MGAVATLSAMTERAAKSAKCGATTRSGKACGRPAGAGTGHVGRGPCKLHTGSTPAQERNAARAAAYDFVEGQLGYEAAIDPLEAASMAVRLAAGAVAFWRMQILAAYEQPDGQPSTQAIEGYRTALQDLSRMADNASKAGVLDRLIAITEQMAEQISLAFEDALRGEGIEPGTRVKLVQKFGAALLALEAAAPPPLELTA